MAPVSAAAGSEALERIRRRVGREYRRATSPARLVPGFLIVGAARAGSTSLYSYLVQHPLVGAATHKEIHFFDLNFERGLAWYRQHFPTVAHRALAKRRFHGELITGEASPYYLFHPLVPGRVRSTLWDARIIALLRDPVKRAYSQYQLQRRSGHEPLSFQEALGREPERIRAETDRLLRDPGYRSEAHRQFSYLARGVYADQLERWFSAFPREQVLVVRSEDLFADPGRTLREVQEFLRLPPHEPPDFRALNVSEYPEMSPASRQFLADYYRPHNRRLYELLGRDLGWE